MKKVLLTIFAVAITLASCKNYDDDFTALNKTIADLQAQVAGFSTLQTGLTSLQSSVGSLQTTVTALQASVDGIPTDQVDLSGLEGDLADALANIASLQADLSGIVGDYATGTDLATTQASIDALNLDLAAAQLDITAILASNNVYTGDLDLASSAGLAFATSLGDKVSIVNGNVTVDNTNISVAGVDAVTSKILTVTGFVDVTSDSSVDFSALASVGNYYKVIGVDIEDDALTAVTNGVTLNYDGGYTQPNLTSAGAVLLADYDSAATGKTGTLMVDFSGLSATSIATGSPFMVVTGATAGTVVFGDATSIKFKGGATNVTAPKAATVDMLAANYKTGLTVSATLAGSVITIAGRVDNGATPTATGQALSVTGSATSILNAAAVTKVAALTVTALTVDFTALTTAAAVTLTKTTPVAFPALTVGAVVTADDAVAFTAASLVATSLDAALAKDITLASTATLNAAVLENVTFTALASTYTVSSTVKTADITGKVGSTNGFTSTGGTLVTGTFGGELDAVSITGLGSSSDKLTSLTTTGAIDSFTLDNSDVITAVSLGHNYIVGGAGSTLVVTNNAKLAALTTSTDYLKTLTVTGNALLTTMDFSSYVNVISAGAVAILIYDNKLSGDYDAAVAPGANPYVETVITSADLATLKPFVAAYKAAFAAPSTTASFSVRASIMDVDPTTGTTFLPVAMLAETVANTVDDVDTTVADGNTTIAEMLTEPTSGITSVAEFLLIQ